MLKRTEKIRLVFLGTILAMGVTAGYFINLQSVDSRLPVISPSDLNPSLVDSSIRHVTKNHRIADFSLINQEGKTISLAELNNKVYVADFFFTTCQGICLEMAEQMQRVYQIFKEDARVVFVSHSVMPEQDTAEALRAYARKYEASPDKWIFLTGEKKQIYDLARKSYFAVTTQGDGGEKDFIHTENFVLIDAQKRIRGYYDGTSREEVDRLIRDIPKLLEEMDKQEH